MLRKVMLLAAITTLSVASAGAGEANTKYAHLPTVNWRMSQTQGPTNYMAVAYGDFAKWMAEKSGGKFLIETYDSGIMGAEAQVLENMQMGVVVAGTFAAANQLANFVPAYTIFALPALFKDSQSLVDVMADKQSVDKLNDACAQKGLINYGYFQTFYHRIFTTEKISHIIDLRGKKIRVQDSRPFVATFQKLGCRPLTTPWVDLSSALRLGICDGMDHVATTIQSSAFYKTLKYVIEPKLIISPMFVVVSKPMYDKLPKEFQELLDEGMNTVLLPNLREEADKVDAAAMKFLTTEGKMTLVECDPASMQDAVADVRDRFLAEQEPWVQEIAKKILAK